MVELKQFNSLIVEIKKLTGPSVSPTQILQSSQVSQSVQPRSFSPVRSLSQSSPDPSVQLGPSVSPAQILHSSQVPQSVQPRSFSPVRSFSQSSPDPSVQSGPLVSPAQILQSSQVP